jgi:hypothetical protein
VKEDDIEEPRHFCVGPKVFDTACGDEGNYMTVYWDVVTCLKCKEKRERR